MGMGLIVPSLLDVTKVESRSGLLDCLGGLDLPGKSASAKTVPPSAAASPASLLPPRPRPPLAVEARLVKTDATRPQAHAFPSAPHTLGCLRLSLPRRPGDPAPAPSASSPTETFRLQEPPSELRGGSGCAGPRASPVQIHGAQPAAGADSTAPVDREERPLAVVLFG
jgi:hypothetical protein